MTTTLLIVIAVGVWLQLLLFALVVGRVTAALTKVAAGAKEWAAQQQRQAAVPGDG